LRRWALLLLLLLLSNWSVGCAHRTGQGGPRLQSPPTGGSPGLTLDAIRIRAGEDRLTGLAGYDADDLFRLGFEAFEAADFELSGLLYDRLLLEFPEHSNALPARFNLAMAREKEGSLHSAIDHLQRYIDQVSKERAQDAAESRVRLASWLQRSDRYEESREPLRLAMEEPSLDRPERWEARILSVMLLGYDGEFERASVRLHSISRDMRQSTRRLGERFPYQSAMLWYHAGALYRLRAASISLDAVDQLELLKSNLDEKARSLLEARQHFKRCLKHLIAEWSGPSALALGAVYEDFRRDLLAAPVPTDLDDEQAVVYRELLSDRTLRFLEKAASDYREVLRSANRFQLEPSWVAEVDRALQRCEQELDLLRLASAQGEPSSVHQTTEGGEASQGD